MVFWYKLCVAQGNFILGISAICQRNNFLARLDFEPKSLVSKVA